MVGGRFGAHTPFEGLSSPRGAAAFKTFKDLPHRNLKSVPGYTFETFKDVRLQAATFKPRVPPCLDCVVTQAFLKNNKLH